MRGRFQKKIAKKLSIHFNFVLFLQIQSSEFQSICNNNNNNNNCKIKERQKN